MGVVDVQFKTITCNTCGKSVTYQHPQDLQATVEANVWIKTSRFVQTGDQRTFLYCSDQRSPGSDRGSSRSGEACRRRQPGNQGRQARHVAHELIDDMTRENKRQISISNLWMKKHPEYYPQPDNRIALLNVIELNGLDFTVATLDAAYLILKLKKHKFKKRGK